MKRQHQQSLAKLSHGARDLLLSMSTKKPIAAVVLAVIAKCRGLWQGLTGSARLTYPSAEDYFRWSYEFSCTNTPVVRVKGSGHRRHRRLPPCVGGKQAREMVAIPFTGTGGCSPEAGGWHEIDGLAEEFIKRFHQQLQVEREKTCQPHSVRPARAVV